LFCPPISLPPPPPLPLLALLIVASHPLPLLLFLIVVSHLIVVVVILLLSLHHHLVVNVSSFVMGSDSPSCVASTYFHPATAAPDLATDALRFWKECQQ
jgi:ABC-type multidrug transport system permease subunit